MVRRCRLTSQTIYPCNLKHRAHKNNCQLLLTTLPMWTYIELCNLSNIAIVTAGLLGTAHLCLHWMAPVLSSARLCSLNTAGNQETSVAQFGDRRYSTEVILEFRGCTIVIFWPSKMTQIIFLFLTVSFFFSICSLESTLVSMLIPVDAMSLHSTVSFSPKNTFEELNRNDFL